MEIVASGLLVTCVFLTVLFGIGALAGSVAFGLYLNEELYWSGWKSFFLSVVLALVLAFSCGAMARISDLVAKWNDSLSNSVSVNAEKP